MIVPWPLSVSKKIYGVSYGYKENARSAEFDSGAKRVFLKNTTMKKKYAVSLALKDGKNDSEFATFLNWYENVLGGTSGIFTFPSLSGSGDALYRFDEDPSWEGQKIKEISMNWEEA